GEPAPAAAAAVGLAAVGQAPGARVDLPAGAGVDPADGAGRGPLPGVPGHPAAPPADLLHPPPEGWAVPGDEQVDHLVEEGHAYLAGVFPVVVGGAADDPLLRLAEPGRGGEPVAPVQGHVRAGREPAVEVGLPVCLVEGLKLLDGGQGNSF